MVPYAAYAGSWGSPESSESKTLGTWALARCLAKRIAIYIYRWKRPRMRRRRLHMSRTDPKRHREDLRTTNRQDSTDTAVMVASSISRIKIIIFFGPKAVSHCSLWTINERNDTRSRVVPIFLKPSVSPRLAASRPGREAVCGRKGRRTSTGLHRAVLTHH